MRLLLYVALVCVAFVLTSNAPSKPVQYEAPAVTIEPSAVAEEKQWTKDDIKDEIVAVSHEYGIDPQAVDAVIFCESSYNKDALGDGGKSRGLAQIHADYHPEITDEQAYDPEYAIDFLAKNMKEGRSYLWTCARKLKV